MIIGNPFILAIESEITHAYERLSFRALGFFAIHVCGLNYGVRMPDATMLACSFDEVERRIARRGTHTAFFAEFDAAKVADAFRSAMYADEQEDNYFGISRGEFRDLFHSQHILWAPDGDAAFDDGSYVLQFDSKDRARVIAFRCGKDGLHAPETLSDVWLAADNYYGILQQWHDAFLTEWESSFKIADSDGT